MSSTDYIKYDVNNVEEQLNNKGKRLPGKAVTPIAQWYHPELGATNEIDQDNITTFQELIRILRWAIKIGRVDILF